MKNWIIYILGIILFAIGAKFFVNSNLGVDPIDCVLIGLHQCSRFLIGTCSILVTLLFLGLSYIISRKIPHWSSFITAPICGYILDFLNYQFPNSGINNFGFLGIALFLCSYGSALILESRLGIRIMDVFILALNKKYNISFTTLKIVIELVILMTGILLGGPFGIATILFVFLVGPLITIFDRINHKLFKLPTITNYE